MAGTVTVRPAEASDVAEAGRVTVAAFRASNLVPEGARYEDELADAVGRARDAELLVAVSGGRVVGTVTFCRYGSRYAEIAGSGEAEFRMLAVDPAAWRTGVGEALVRAVVRRTRQTGAGAVVLSVPHNAYPAQRLYQRLGFVRVPERDHSPVAGVFLLAYRLVL